MFENGKANLIVNNPSKKYKHTNSIETLIKTIKYHNHIKGIVIYF